MTRGRQRRLMDPVDATPFQQPDPGARPQFLTDADCHEIAQRLNRYASGGGYTGVLITSTWRGGTRWGRNLIDTGSDIRTNHLVLARKIQGATSGFIEFNDTSDEALVAALRRAERLARLEPEKSNDDIVTYIYKETGTSPTLFHEATYQLDADQRAAVARKLSQSAADAGMLSAGYIEVSARSVAFLTSWGFTRYFQYTWAQCSMTVRDPKGTGSGWAGVDWPDWSRIDGEKLAQIALEKCLQSRNPVAIEPGRYTTILESQAVCDLVSKLIPEMIRAESNTPNETDARGIFNKEPRTFGPKGSPGYSQLGEKIVDERITISADPMDPDLGFPPFGLSTENDDLFTQVYGPVYHPVTWIERGVLTNLSYSRFYALGELGQTNGLPNSLAFRMSGGDTTIAEMIATTKRGLLVTRFDRIDSLTDTGLLYRGYTRDGLWLIENGKISKPVKNLAFTESPLFVLDNVEALGVPQRVFHPPGSDWINMPQPVIVPPLQIRDFSFTALVDAV